MFKLGVTNIDQLVAEIQSPSRYMTKQVAIPLLEILMDSNFPRSYRERLLLELADDRGAFKRTYRKRFDAFDTQVSSIIQEHMGVDDVSILDCGVSDAITSVDFFRKLSKTLPKIYYFATDYDPTIAIVKKGDLILSLSSNLEPMQLVFGRFVFNLTSPDSWLTFPINRFMAEILTRTKIKSIMADLADGSLTVEELTLFDPEALQLEVEDSRFQLGKMDVRNNFPGISYSVVRMMNILNPEYFLNNELAEILNNANRALREGGLLIVGSNQDAGTVVNGVVLEKQGSNWLELYVSGLGLDLNLREHLSIFHQ